MANPRLCDPVLFRCCATNALPLPCASVQLLGLTMRFHRLSIAIRFLANAGLVLAVAPLGSAIPLRDPSALCRRAALLRLCTSLLGFAFATAIRYFATAPLGYAFPLQSCSLPCRLRSKAHQAMPWHIQAMPSLLVSWLVNAMPMPFHSDHCCSMQCHCFSWLTMQCHCASTRR